MAKAAEIKCGDKVALNSGGPMMTVVDVGKYSGRVWCRWLKAASPSDGRSVQQAGEIAEGDFPAAALKILDRPQPSPEESATE